MCNSISLCISGEEVKNLKHNKCCLNSLHFLQILQLSSFVFCSQICGFLWVVKFKEKIIHLGGLLTFDATFWIRNICCQATRFTQEETDIQFTNCAKKGSTKIYKMKSTFLRYCSTSHECYGLKCDWNIMLLKRYQIRDIYSWLKSCLNS